MANRLKCILFVLALVISYLPVFLYVKYVMAFNFFSGNLVHVFVLLGLLVIAGFINPMYTLSISLVGGFSSLNPVNVFKAIGHVFLPYFLTVIFIIFLQGLSVAAHVLPFKNIPLIGFFFKWFVNVYFLFVNFRLLGIFYKAHRQTLRWYGEDDEDD